LQSGSSAIERAIQRIAFKQISIGADRAGTDGRVNAEMFQRHHLRERVLAQPLRPVLPIAQMDAGCSQTGWQKCDAACSLEKNLAGHLLGARFVDRS
jgi:hypothetical protein